MIDILNTTDTLIAIENSLQNNDKTFFIRFGDNDLYNMIGYDANGNKLGKKELGGNKTVWTEELQRDLLKSFSIVNNGYLKGMSGSWEIERGMVPGVFGSPRHKNVDVYTKRITDEKIFLNPIVFHYLFAFKPGLLKYFIDKYIYDKRVLFIGSAVNVEGVFGGFKSKVLTPEKNSYSAKDRVLDEVMDKIKGIDVVILACGQLGRAIAHYLWRMDLSFNCFDVGSFVDVFDNKKTRRWLKKCNLEENVKILKNEEETV
jgi:hypothetical protein